jgi:hypothetical protein
VYRGGAQLLCRPKDIEFLKKDWGEQGICDCTFVFLLFSRPVSVASFVIVQFSASLSVVSFVIMQFSEPQSIARFVIT